MQDDDNSPRTIVKGWTTGFDVVVPENREAMGIRFEFFQEADGKMLSSTIEVATATEIVMALLLNLKEIQRVFDIPMPEVGTFALNKVEESPH